MKLPNPLISGFNPDPSVVRVGEDYYLCTSTFEYLPGIPIYHSTDLIDWELIGHVLTRTEQFDAATAPTNGGIWAPTIRWRDGVFHVIVATMESGTRVYSATDPAGPWSDGTHFPGIEGIDPDLAWDCDGTCYITYSGLILNGPNAGAHLGIQQAKVDFDTGALLEEPRSIWSGTGLMFPEAPHLYRIAGLWYLMLAEGGTERGHAVSIARSESPEGPFESCPANPILSARSTARPIQNTGHGDLVVAPDGSWSMVLLGMRTRGMTRSFSALGRETFGTHVEWADRWPVVEPVELSEGRDGAPFSDDFTSATFGLDWVGVRRRPDEVASITDGSVCLTGEGRSMSHPQPTFVGRRQRRHAARITATVSGEGTGGLAIRYDEEHHYQIERSPGRVVGRLVLPGIRQEWEAAIADGPTDLVLEMHPTELRFDPEDPANMNQFAPCDRIHLVAIDGAGVRHELAVVDGRFMSAESTCSFTGRVAGVYCETGQIMLEQYREDAL